MPGWHDATRALRDTGRLGMVGILQEQHPDRALLFMQWRQMEWPLLVDALDLLEVAVVPITVLVDEHGIIRERPRGIPDASALEAFIETTFPAPTDARPAAAPSAPDLALLAQNAQGGEVIALRQHAESLVLWGNDTDLDTAITAFGSSVEADPAQGPTHFRLGVAHRARHDSAHRRPGDFQHAVDAWSRALDLDPNQYIWRRRIQQYGPRLAKPYPFYDWVEQARTDVVARGETPAPLRIEPGATERAAPAKSLDVQAKVEPDPEGRVLRDKGFIVIEATVVPATVAPGDATRLHVTLRPEAARKGHWNNEAEDLVVWIDPPTGWRAGARHHTVTNPPELVSDEPRTVELELRASDAVPNGTTTVRGYALYYVCEDVDGTCLYRRQDISLPLTVSSTR